MNGRWNIRRVLCLVIAACLLLGLTACGDVNKSAAETVLRLYLSTNEELMAAYGEASAPGADESAILTVLEAQAGAYLAEDFMEDFAQGNTFSLFCRMAYGSGFTSEFTKLRITKSEGQYLYDASLHIQFPDGGELKASVNGTVLFDESGKIRDITLGGSGMEALMQYVM